MAARDEFRQRGMITSMQVSSGVWVEFVLDHSTPSKRTTFLLTPKTAAPGTDGNAELAMVQAALVQAAFFNRYPITVYATARVEGDVWETGWVEVTTDPARQGQ